MGLNVKQWQRLGLTFVARELRAMTPLAFSKGVAELLSGWCSPLKQGQSQGGISLLRAVQSWPICSVKGGSTPHPKPAHAIQEMEEGIGGDVTSLLVVLTHLEHRNPKGWTTKSAEGSYFEIVDVSLWMKLSTDQYQCNAQGRDCNPNFLYTKMKHELTFYSGKNHTNFIIWSKNKVCAKMWLIKERTD